MQAYKDKLEFLRFEIMRYETYILTLRTRKSPSPAAAAATTGTPTGETSGQQHPNPLQVWPLTQFFSVGFCKKESLIWMEGKSKNKYWFIPKQDLLIWSTFSARGFPNLLLTQKSRLAPRSLYAKGMYMWDSPTTLSKKTDEKPTLFYPSPCL